VGTRHENAGGRARHPGDALDRQLPRDDAAVVSGDHAAAAAIPRQRCRELDRSRGAPRALAVPAVSDRDQPVRDSHRHRRPRHLSVRRIQHRHVRAGATDLGGRDIAQCDRVHRRPVRRHRDGDRGMRRVGHHGVE